MEETLPWWKFPVQQARISEHLPGVLWLYSILRALSEVRFTCKILIFYEAITANLGKFNTVSFF